MSIYKIIIVGESGVGKTSLLTYIFSGKNVTQQQSNSTIGIDVQFISKNINEEPIKICLWDTAGQEKYNSINKTYYRGSIGAVICFSLSCNYSFSSVKKYLVDIKDILGQNIHVALVGTFSDLQQVVSDNDIFNFITEEQISSFAKVSNLNGENICKFFDNLVQSIHNAVKNGHLVNSLCTSQNILEPATDPKIKTKLCCK